MAFIQANIYSNVLEMEVNLNVILPQTTKKVIGTSSEQATTDIPVLYLLHGMGGNHSVWERRTSIERYVADYGLAVIMPSTDLGWYTDTVYDMKYWTFIAEELPEICLELFPQLTRKGKNICRWIIDGRIWRIKTRPCKIRKFRSSNLSFRRCFCRKPNG